MRQRATHRQHFVATAVCRVHCVTVYTCITYSACLHRIALKPYHPAVLYPATLHAATLHPTSCHNLHFLCAPCTCIPPMCVCTAAGVNFDHDNPHYNVLDSANEPGQCWCFPGQQVGMPHHGWAGTSGAVMACDGIVWCVCSEVFGWGRTHWTGLQWTELHAHPA